MENKEISRKDVIMACAEEEKPGVGSCNIYLTNELWKLDGTTETVSEMLFDDPIVHIYNGGKYFTVDLIFDSPENKYLKHLTKLLNDFTQPDKSLDKEVTAFPTTVVCIAPRSLNDEYYILATHMIYWDRHCYGEETTSRVVRMLFDEEDFVFYEDDEVKKQHMEEGITI